MGAIKYTNTDYVSAPVMEHSLIVMDSVDGARTVLLSTPIPGAEAVTIQSAETSLNDIVITSRGSALIGGVSSYTLSEAGQAVTLKPVPVITAGVIQNIGAWEIAGEVGGANLASVMALKAPKASPTFTGTVTIPTPFTLGAVSVLPTGTELNFVDGVTSAIQTQLDAKAPIASPTFTGTVTGVTKAMVGLSNATNTSDANKPVSTDQQTALDLKGNITGQAFITPDIGVATGTSLAATGLIKSSSPTAGIGYAAGAGGSQTQQTDKSTTVESDTITTSIEMNNATLNAGVTVSFTFTNSSIAATDTVLVTHESAGTSAAYSCNAFPGAGSAVISVRNNTAGNLSEGIVLRVTVIKSVSA